MANADAIPSAARHAESIPCIECNRTPRTVPMWFCTDCKCSFCDRCWEKISVHRAGVASPHERVYQRTYLLLSTALEPPATDVELDQLHADDVETTWFGEQAQRLSMISSCQLIRKVTGIGKDENNEPFLADGTIFDALMARARCGNDTRHPQIVSFVGQTGIHRFQSI